MLIKQALMTRYARFLKNNQTLCQTFYEVMYIAC